MDDFSELAKKIRMEKIDKKEIQKLKQETVKNEREKNKKKKSILIIQKFIRGFLSRKKFNIKMNDINTKTIVEYLQEKHKKYIMENADKVISFYLNLYLNSKKKYNDKILDGYKNYCSDLIKATYLSYKIRKKLKPIRDLIKTKKQIISKYVAGYKIRMILRSNSIQNILVEIANIKFILKSNNENTDNLEENLKNRLPKLFYSFYETFYDLKYTGLWIEQPKTENFWYLQYFSLIYKDNPKYAIEHNKFSTNKKNNLEKSKINFEEKNSMNLNNNNNNIQFNNDERPIKPMKNNFDMNLNKENEDLNNNLQNNNKTNNAYEDYDNKPIGGKKINYNEMFGDGEDNNNLNQNNKTTKKKIKKNTNKKPKYDARKAIEEAKAKEAKEGKKEKKSEFREFLKEMKKLAKEEKQGKLDSKNNVLKSNENLNSQGGFGGSSDFASSQQVTEENKPEERKNRKKPTKEIELRRKLHELERSPPPKLNIKNIKSKVGSLNGISIKKNNNNNKTNSRSPGRATMNKRNMKSLNKKGNKDSSNKNNINIKSIKKTGFNEETIFKKINNIQREVNKLSNFFNLNSYFEKKDKNMQKYKKIPYIKPDCSYIKSYSNNIYGKIIDQINKQYDEIKN